MDATTVVDRVVIPAGATKADVQSLYEVLASVPDGHKRCGKRYLAALVLTLLLLAKMSGEGEVEWRCTVGAAAHRLGADPRLT